MSPTGPFLAGGRCDTDPKPLGDRVRAQVGNVAGEHAKVDAVKGHQQRGLEELGPAVDEAGQAGELEDHEPVARPADRGAAVVRQKEPLVDEPVRAVRARSRSSVNLQRCTRLGRVPGTHRGVPTWTGCWRAPWMT